MCLKSGDTDSRKAWALIESAFGVLCAEYHGECISVYISNGRCRTVYSSECRSGAIGHGPLGSVYVQHVCGCGCDSVWGGEDVGMCVCDYT